MGSLDQRRSPLGVQVVRGGELNQTFEQCNALLRLSWIRGSLRNRQHAGHANTIEASPAKRRGVPHRPEKNLNRFWIFIAWRRNEREDQAAISRPGRGCTPRLWVANRIDY